MTKMKDSNIEWVGSIPENWDLCRLQHCLMEINVKNNPVQTTQVLSLMKDVGVLPYEEKGDIGNKSKENVSEYHLAYPSTIVLNCMNILIGSVGISNYFGCVSPVYYVFKETENSDLRFINYIFNTREFQKELRKYAKGILEIRLRVSASDIFKQKIALPTKEEQIRIANFLDNKCFEIDSLSADIQSQIDVLEEYKKSIITEAVTKGLNPEVEMKDSGIEWIGMIPKHWSVLRIKQMCSKITDGSHFSPTTVDFGKKYLTAANVNNDIVDTENTKEISANDFNILVKTGCRPQKNDVLLTKDGSVGRTAVVTDDNDYVILSSIGILTPNSNTDSVFLKYSIDGNYLQHQMLQSMQGAALKRITISKIMEYKNIVPPIEEQKEIANHLLVKCAEIDAVIADKKAQLETLAEYKKSLIYEYVTGKKEVPTI